MSTVPVVGRIELDVDGERVVVSPFTMEELNSLRPTGPLEAVDAFAAHITEPTDANANGFAWVCEVMAAWRTAMEAQMTRALASARRSATRGLTGHLPPSGRRH